MSRKCFRRSTSQLVSPTTTSRSNFVHHESWENDTLVGCFQSFVALISGRHLRISSRQSLRDTIAVRKCKPTKKARGQFLCGKCFCLSVCGGGIRRSAKGQACAQVQKSNLDKEEFFEDDDRAPVDENLLLPDNGSA